MPKLWKQIQDMGAMKINSEKGNRGATMAKNDRYLSIATRLTGMGKHLSSLVTSMQWYEDVFQGLLLSEDFTREGYFHEELLFATWSILWTQESV